MQTLTEFKIYITFIAFLVLPHFHIYVKYDMYKYIFISAMIFRKWNKYYKNVIIW